MIRIGRKTAAVLIFTSAFLLRAVYSFHLPRETIEPDERIYSDLAANFLAGRGLISNQDFKRDIFRPGQAAPPATSRYRYAAFPPFYPFFLAGLYLAGVRSLIGVRLVQAVVGALSCLALAWIAENIAGGRSRGEKIAGLAAGMMAFYPPLIRYSSLLLTETVFVFLVMAMVAFLLRFREKERPSISVLAGLFAGMGILCRPTLIPFTVLAAVWLWFRASSRRAAFAPFILAAALVLTPWTARNYRLLGRLIPVTTQGGSNLYLANNPLSRGGTVSRGELVAAGIFHLGEDEDEVEYNRGYGRLARNFIRAHPLRFLKLSLRRLAWFYHLDGHRLEFWYLLIPFWLVLLTGLGGIYLAWRRKWEWSLPALFILIFTIIHMTFLPEGRYRLPLMPFFLLFSAITLTTLSDGAGKRRKAVSNPEEGFSHGKP